MQEEQEDRGKKNTKCEKEGRKETRLECVTEERKQQIQKRRKNQIRINGGRKRIELGRRKEERTEKMEEKCTETDGMTEEEQERRKYVGYHTLSSTVTIRAHTVSDCRG